MKKDIFSNHYSDSKKKIASFSELFRKSKKEIITILWKENPDIKKILSGSPDIVTVRKNIFSYLNSQEKELFHVYSDSSKKKLSSSKKGVAKESIRIVKNILRTENENLTGFSALKKLVQLANNKEHAEKKIQNGFLFEFIYLFRSIKGNPSLLESGLQHSKEDLFGEDHIRKRTEELNVYSYLVQDNIKKYRTGYDEELIKKRERLQDKILQYYNAREKDWNDYLWHYNNIIDDSTTLSRLVHLETDELEGLEAAKQYKIPFQITPYYLSLFNMDGRCDWDRVLRAQVIPSRSYCRKVHENQSKGENMDFMGEKWTSPVDSITHRYPQIIILKPYDTCPQICVYCQRNWEIKKTDEAFISKKKMEKAIRWIEENPAITEVLITGGDPLYLENEYLEQLFQKLCSIPHVMRLRIGTRILVTVPQRINEGFLQILKKFHQPGKREICIMTHFEHSTEMTLANLDAVQKIRRLGISVYNQQVFTYYNSRRFETALLRKTLKISGIDPYYTFNTKGKEETQDYRVPIARIEQERNEEARLLPGVERTDEPVFNVPLIGKSHLRAWQTHEPIMILASGQRVYRFYPWESRLKRSDDYIYTDVSIYNYLQRLDKDGEDPDRYQSIWYYY